MNKEQLKSQAKYAYERARLVVASKLLFIVVPVVCISLATRGNALLPLALGAALAVAVVLFKWRGQEYGAAVRPGLLAGLTAFAIPMAFHILGLCCRMDIESEICLLSGLIGGIILGRQVGGLNQKRIRSLLFSVLVAGLTAALGCISLGVGAVVGLFFALVISSVSTLSLIKSASLQK